MDLSGLINLGKGMLDIYKDVEEPKPREEKAPKEHAPDCTKQKSETSKTVAPCSSKPTPPPPKNGINCMKELTKLSCKPKNEAWKELQRLNQFKPDPIKASKTNDCKISTPKTPATKRYRINEKIERRIFPANKDFPITMLAVDWDSEEDEQQQQMMHVVDNTAPCAIDPLDGLIAQLRDIVYEPMATKCASKAIRCAGGAEAQTSIVDTISNVLRDGVNTINDICGMKLDDIIGGGGGQENTNAADAGYVPNVYAECADEGESVRCGPGACKAPPSNRANAIHSPAGTWIAAAARTYSTAELTSSRTSNIIPRMQQPESSNDVETSPKSPKTGCHPSISVEAYHQKQAAITMLNAALSLKSERVQERRATKREEKHKMKRNEMGPINVSARPIDIQIEQSTWFPWNVHITDETPVNEDPPPGNKPVKKKHKVILQEESSTTTTNDELYRPNASSSSEHVRCGPGACKAPPSNRYQEEPQPLPENEMAFSCKPNLRYILVFDRNPDPGPPPPGQTLRSQMDRRNKNGPYNFVYGARKCGNNGHGIDYYARGPVGPFQNDCGKPLQPPVSETLPVFTSENPNRPDAVSRLADAIWNPLSTLTKELFANVDEKTAPEVVRNTKPPSTNSTSIFKTNIPTSSSQSILKTKPPSTNSNSILKTNIPTSSSQSILKTKPPSTNSKSISRKKQNSKKSSSYSTESTDSSSLYVVKKRIKVNSKHSKLCVKRKGRKDESSSSSTSSDISHSSSSESSKTTSTKGKSDEESEQVCNTRKEFSTQTDQPCIEKDTSESSWGITPSTSSIYSDFNKGPLMANKETEQTAEDYMPKSILVHDKRMGNCNKKTDEFNHKFLCEDNGIRNHNRKKPDEFINYKYPDDSSDSCGSADTC